MDDYNFSGIPTATGGSGNANNSASNENNNSAVPKLYLASGSGLGFLSSSGATLGSSAGTSSLMNQVGKSTL